MRPRSVAMAVAVLLLFALPGTVAAQAADWDPAGAVAAYAAALNAHDLDAALALFDEYGSATDAAGHHFEGRAGLIDFLRGSGFGNPDAHVTTENLHVVANRAVWRYTCSCAPGSTEVRIVMNRSRISVFAEMAPPAAPLRKSGGGSLPWVVASGLGLAALAGALSRRRRRAPLPEPVPRATQGRLLAGLVQARGARTYAPGPADSTRVELPL